MADTSERFDLLESLDAIASGEGRTAREAIRDAVFLYLSLPPAARRALHALSVIGCDEDRAAISEAATPAIVRAGFEAARRTGAAAAARAYPNGRLANEDDVEAEAVRLARAANASHR
jgi:hypothetical protein